MFRPLLTRNSSFGRDLKHLMMTGEDICAIFSYTRLTSHSLLSEMLTMVLIMEMLESGRRGTG